MMSLKKLTALSLQFLLTFTFLFHSLLLSAQAPTHRGKFDFIDNNINGFWEYLPRNYHVDGEKKYPLLIFIHGAGESGNTQDMATLSRVKIAGVPYLIDQGDFPETFTVAEKTFSFIVLSPQIKNGIEIANNVGTSIIQPSTIDAVINYAKRTYANRIDESRIYLTGLSMGGGGTWDYAGSSPEAAKKLAAIVVAAGAGDLSMEEANNIAAAKLPVIATHNNEDSIVRASRTQANIARINNFTPTISPKAFYFTTGVPRNHNVWSATFEQLEPKTTSGGNLPQVLGTNVYRWLLQQQRAEALPLTWKSFSLLVNSQQITLEWNVGNERQLKHYEVERSAEGSNWKNLATVLPQAGNSVHKKYVYHDANPLQGVNHYRVKQVDLDGAFTYSPVRSLNFSSAVNGIKIFPNPVADKLFISSGDRNHEELIIKIYASSGELIGQEKKQVSDNQVEISMTGRFALAKGLLVVRILDEKGKMIHQQTVLKIK